MVDEGNQGKLLIFDYAPNLKVVGTYHSLNEEDRRVLEDLIDRSDFIAIEYDEARLRHKGELNMCLHVSRRGYFPEKNILYCGLSDTIYLASFYILHKRGIEIANKQLSPKTDQRKFDFSNNEFEFCYRVAGKKGKNIYLVDIPSFVLLQKLSELPLKVKLLHLLAMINEKELPKEVTDIMEIQREKGMLDEIVKNEGPISELTRKGVLVVGYTHAQNYANPHGYIN